MEADVLPRPRATRLRNALVRAGVVHLDQLRALAGGQLASAPGLGPTHLGLVRRLIAAGRGDELAALIAEAPALLPPVEQPADGLMPRERDVLLVRQNGRLAPLTRQQIAAILGVSPTRVAQLESRAVDKLRVLNNARLRGLPVSERARSDLAVFADVVETLTE